MHLHLTTLLSTSFNPQNYFVFVCVGLLLNDLNFKITLIVSIVISMTDGVTSCNSYLNAYIMYSACQPPTPYSSGLLEKAPWAHLRRDTRNTLY